jgi:ketosteroid isomerase-like protein
VDPSDTGGLLRRYLETIPDVRALEPLLHEDVAFTLFTPRGKTRKGRDRILGGLTREFQNFYVPETFRLTVLASFGDGVNAAARFEISADTNRGPYRNDYSIIARFADGLLIEAWEYVDSASAINQLAPRGDD